ncbi:MAG: hypothetical protein IIB38_14515 [Candidatus Hydrogenedentes bacterium]|nr:hypothetical protein [Candidatus Hydrogenedentota bacterium]
MAEVAVPRDLFRKILSLIDDLRRRPVPAWAEGIDGEEKATGEVHLDDGKYGQIAFRARPTHKNKLPDGCGGKTITTAAQFEYDRHGFEGYLGNVG